jgi:hypothetical protein
MLQWLKQALINFFTTGCSGECEQGRKPCNCDLRCKK